MTRMARDILLPAALLLAAAPAVAATAQECLQFEVKADGDAVLTNKCSDPLNLLYCVERDTGARPCSQPSGLVVTLHYGVSETLPGYVAAGKPAVRSAVCFYPEAPVDWKPAAGATWGCKKTCVMC